MFDFHVIWSPIQIYKQYSLKTEKYSNNFKEAYNYEMTMAYLTRSEK